MYFLLLLLLLLTVSDSDAVLSVRWLRNGQADRDILAWPTWLFKIQLSLVYFYTAVAKVNPTFLRGDVFAERLTLPGPLTTPAALMLLAAGAVAVEFFLSFALWVPSCVWGFACGIDPPRSRASRDGALCRSHRVQPRDLECLRPPRGRAEGLQAGHLGRSLQRLREVGDAVQPARLALHPEIRGRESAPRPGRSRRYGRPSARGNPALGRTTR